MDKDKRNRQKPVPTNIGEFLNDDQQMALSRIESFGWRIEFIRRPLFEKPTVVVFGPDNGQIGVLEENGQVNHNAGIKLRESDLQK